MARTPKKYAHQMKTVILFNCVPFRNENYLKEKNLRANAIPYGIEKYFYNIR